MQDHAGTTKNDEYKNLGDWIDQFVTTQSPNRHISLLLDLYDKELFTEPLNWPTLSYNDDRMLVAEVLLELANGFSYRPKVIKKIISMLMGSSIFNTQYPESFLKSHTRGLTRTLRLIEKAQCEVGFWKKDEAEKMLNDSFRQLVVHNPPDYGGFSGQMIDTLCAYQRYDLLQFDGWLGHNLVTGKMILRFRADRAYQFGKLVARSRHEEQARAIAIQLAAEGRFDQTFQDIRASYPREQEYS